MNDTFEATSRLEPCLLEDAPMRVVDLATGLAAAAQTLGSRLHPRTAASLAALVREMNCYYSNLIEGHNTTLRDIQAALRDRLDADEATRNLQLEARAHIRLQRAIDRRFAEDALGEPADADFVRWLHREFYVDAPDGMLVVTSAGGRAVRMTPGAFRAQPEEEDVVVGNHLPPSPARVAAFMAHFEQRYRMAPMGPGRRALAMAAAHHRLNWIHPFLDGNGRVSRLVAHAMALQAGIGAHGLWSVSRGLARGLAAGPPGRAEYKRMMAMADTPRQGDLDGRGNLSQRALVDFTAWFLEICLDQVRFMAGLFAFDTLEGRLHAHVARRGLPPGAAPLLVQILRRGEVPRGDAPAIVGLKDRAARGLLAKLLEDGIVASDTPKGPVSLRFPADAVEVLFPSLFPSG